MQSQMKNSYDPQMKKKTNFDMISIWVWYPYHNPVEFLSVLSRPSLIQACCWISLNVGRFLSSGFNNHRINSRIWRATGIAGLKRNSQRVISRSFGNGTLKYPVLTQV